MKQIGVDARKERATKWNFVMGCFRVFGEPEMIVYSRQDSLIQRVWLTTSRRWNTCGLGVEARVVFVIRLNFVLIHFCFNLSYFLICLTSAPL